MTGPPLLSAAYDRARDEARAELVVVDHEPPDDEPRRALRFQRFADLAAEVDAAGPRRYLVRGLWPQGDYGVLSAEPKAGKSWSATDLAVSVATGTPWLGAFAVDQPGPVVWFVGEGGRGNTVRRVRAMCRDRSIDTDDLDLDVVSRAPRLSDDTHMRELAAHLDARRPALVIIDPLYLATGSAAKIGDLPAMGALLERPQLVCQHVGASLVVVHHNRRGDGAGVSKMSGAGPEEWGRVLISGSVRSRTSDPDTGATTVVTHLEVRGGEIADRTVKVTRRVWADDPDDLDSPLHVRTEVGHPDPEPAKRQATSAPAPATGGRLTPAAAKLLEALQAAGQPSTTSRLVDLVSDRHGHGLRRETVSRAMQQLADRGLAIGESQGQFATKLWRPTDSPDLLGAPDPSCDRPCDVTPDGHTEGRRVTGVTAPLQGRGGHTVTRSHGTAGPTDGHTVTRSHESWRVSGEPLPPEPEPEEDR